MLDWTFSHIAEFLVQKPVTRSFDDSVDLCLNKRLSKQSWGWWFEAPSRPSWRHCNVNIRLCWLCRFYAYLLRFMLNCHHSITLVTPNNTTHIKTMRFTGRRRTYCSRRHLNDTYKQHFDGLVQDCSNSIANALELLQSCIKDVFCIYFIIIQRIIKSNRWWPCYICTSIPPYPKSTEHSKWIASEFKQVGWTFRLHSLDSIH